MIITILFFHPLILASIFLGEFFIVIKIKKIKELADTLKFTLYLTLVFALIYWIVLGFVTSDHKPQDESILLGPYDTKINLPIPSYDYKDNDFYIDSERLYILVEEKVVFFIIITFLILNILMIASFLLLEFLNPEDIFLIFRKTKFRKLALTASISLRFMPLLLSDLKSYKQTMKTRGYVFRKKNVIKNYAHLFNAALINTLERSVSVAESLESRAYGTKNATQYSSIRWNGASYFLFVNSFIILMLSLFLRLTNLIHFNMYPSLEYTLFNTTVGIITLVFLFLIISPFLGAKKYVKN